MASDFRIWDVESWLKQISWDQLMAWYEWYTSEPRTDDRIGARIGYGFAGIASMFASKGSNIKVRDFMPDFSAKPKPRTTFAEMKEQAKIYATAK